MTPKEWASALYEEITVYDDMDGTILGSDVEEKLAAAIRAAENEAIERVAVDLWEQAKIAEEMGSHERAQAYAFAAKSARSLKHPERP
jgi:hypothetical protein